MTATATAVAPSLDVAQSSQAVNPNPSARRGTYANGSPSQGFESFQMLEQGMLNGNLYD